MKSKTITLTEDVCQKTPPAFMVFCYKDFENDYMIFGDEVDAWNYAQEQAEEAKKEDWPIYALWAGDWKK